MVDEDDDPKVAAVKELEIECGMTVRTDELIDLTELACQEAVDAGHLAYPGVAPAGGTSDEIVRYYYIEKSVTKQQLEGLQNKLVGAAEFSGHIYLHVVPWDKVWKMSGDSKTMMYVDTGLSVCRIESLLAHDSAFVHFVSYLSPVPCFC